MPASEISAPRTPEAYAAALGNGALRLAVPYRPSTCLWRPTCHGIPIAVYQYESRDGRVVFENHRWHLSAALPSEPSKAFFWRSWNAMIHEWAWGLRCEELVLYRLPQVTSAVASGTTVFVVEGERDVQTAEELGVIATTCPLGALQWRSSYSEALRGADVVVLPDNDVVGYLHAADVAFQLRGVAASVRIVPLPGLPLKGDITTWVEQGNGRAELSAASSGAARDPDDQLIQRILSLPSQCIPLPEKPDDVLQAIASTARSWSVATERSFGVTLKRIRRLDTDISPTSTARSAYDNVLRLIAHDDEGVIADASLVDRRVFELESLRELALASDAIPPLPAGTTLDGVVRRPGCRLVATRFDWEGLAEGVAGEEATVVYLLKLRKPRGVDVSRIGALAAVILEEASAPVDRVRLVDAVVARTVDSVDQFLVIDRVARQVHALLAAGLLVPATLDLAATISAVGREFVGGPSRPSHARMAVGVLARLVGGLLDSSHREDIPVLQGDFASALLPHWFGRSHVDHGALLNALCSSDAEVARTAAHRLGRMLTWILDLQARRMSAIVLE